MWTANARSAAGQYTQATQGNGVIVNRSFSSQTGRIYNINAGLSGAPNSIANSTYGFDTLGNLTSRYDGIQNGTETFQYDNRNRVTQATIGATTRTTSYNAIGNILGKTRLGAATTNSYTYNYSINSVARPYLLSKVTGVVNGITDPTFTYDDNGNMLTGANRTLTWNAFNKVAAIVEGSLSINYTYDAEQQRLKQVSGSNTTIYLNDPASGASSEKQSGSGGTWQDYIFADGQRVSQRTQTATPAATTWQYFVHDHLGSVAVVTDQSGAVVQRLAYDAWGRRRQPNGTEDPSGAITAPTTRGFTDHEHIPDVDLINMNARVYDPEIGRFLSPDPTIPKIFESQALNRYSYVYNTPTSYADPTGLSPWTNFRDKILKPAAAIAIGWYLGPAVYDAVLPSAVGAASAVGLGVTSSTWTGSALAGVMSGSVVGGIAGGVYYGPQGIVQGAKYGGIGGFVSGLFAAMYPETTWGMKRVAVNSMAGGLTSAAQGGNFRDGARSSMIGSAFRYAYNSVVKYDVDPKAGGEAVDKQALTMPVEGKNNFGFAGEVDSTSIGGEGGVVSRIANQIPSINAVAGMHDVFQVRLQQELGVWGRTIFNVPGMPVAAGATWMGLRDAPYLNYKTLQRIEELGR